MPCVRDMKIVTTGLIGGGRSGNMHSKSVKIHLVITYPPNTYFSIWLKLFSEECGTNHQSLKIFDCVQSHNIFLQTRHVLKLEGDGLTD